MHNQDGLRAGNGVPRDTRLDTNWKASARITVTKGVGRNVERHHGFRLEECNRRAEGGEEEDARGLLRAEEVAEVLGIGRSKVFEMPRSGELPVVRMGRAVRVPKGALAEWIESHTVGEVEYADQRLSRRWVIG
jgi:excisionase family DNA binding protein